MIYILYLFVILFFIFNFYLDKLIKFKLSYILGFIFLIVLVILNFTLSNFFINPDFIRINSFRITWYALWICTGIYISFQIALRYCIYIGIKQQTIYIGTLIGIIVCFIGARFWYCLFNKDYSFINFFKLYEGGISIIGAIIFLFIFLIIFCYIKKVNFFTLLEIVLPLFLLGQIFGRMGNFCNHELYGPIMNESLYKLFPKFILDNMTFTKENSIYLLDNLKEGVYHPVFLYEMLLNSFGLLSIYISKKSKYYKIGDILSLYLIIYGISRSLCESNRLIGDVLLIGSIRINFIMSIIFIIFGIIFLFINHILLNSKYYKKYILSLKNERIDTIIFDLDGTLIDSYYHVKMNYFNTFKKLNKDIILEEKDYKEFFGNNIEDVFLKYTKDIKEYVKVFNYYSKDISDIKLIKDAYFILEELSKKYKIALFTNKSKDKTINILKKFNIINYFNIIICKEDVKEKKPNIEGVLKIKKYLKSNNVLYVGDTLFDVQCAKDANCFSCCVFNNIKADYNISRLKDILYIDRLY